MRVLLSGFCCLISTGIECVCVCVFFNVCASLFLCVQEMGKWVVFGCASVHIRLVMKKIGVMCFVIALGLIPSASIWARNDGGGHAGGGFGSGRAGGEHFGGSFGSGRMGGEHFGAGTGRGQFGGWHPSSGITGHPIGGHYGGGDHFGGGIGYYRGGGVGHYHGGAIGRFRGPNIIFLGYGYGLGYGFGGYGLGLSLGYGSGYGYGAPYYAYPPPPTIAVPAVPPAYTEQQPAMPSSTQLQSNYWYYCRDPEGYYPYIEYCPGGWLQVPPQPSTQ